MNANHFGLVGEDTQPYGVPAMISWQNSSDFRCAVDRFTQKVTCLDPLQLAEGGLRPAMTVWALPPRAEANAGALRN
jgi:hypothetical protein